MTLEGLVRPPRDLRLVYRIASTRNPVVQTHAIGYGEAGTPVPGGWRVTVQLKRDADLLHRRYVPLDDADTTLTFHGVAMAFTVTGPEWDTGSTDANISGGHGFFGAVGRFTVAWHLDPVTVGTLGFLDRQETP
ncbi:MAG: hypothetical protein D6746_00260 [Bacteroidetes bacterium]|nr:MAG: hypothetical protein D6746_00260 [Bacteroidota bacterium]